MIFMMKISHRNIREINKNKYIGCSLNNFIPSISITLQTQYQFLIIILKIQGSKERP